MTGQWVTDKQVVIYMNARNQDLTQEVSAAKAGISERTGRDIESGRREPPQLKVRNYRTRKDPFEGVWSSEIVPVLNLTPNIHSTLLLEQLQRKYSQDEYPDSLARTLQRKVKLWRHIEGPEQEIIFRQTHAPGVQALSDFTKLKKVTIQIRGEPFQHLLYHFRLIYSGWSYLQVIIGGESYPALADGLQNALWKLGGVPKEHRTDSLSAAFKNLSKEEAQDLTQQYQQLCEHFLMKATRNNRGKGHENGGVESGLVSK